MFKIYFYFLKDGDWQNDGYSIRDRLPENGDVIYEKGKSYRVLNIEENETEDYHYNCKLIKL